MGEKRENFCPGTVLGQKGKKVFVLGLSWDRFSQDSSRTGQFQDVQDISSVFSPSCPALIMDREGY